MITAASARKIFNEHEQARKDSIIADALKDIEEQIKKIAPTECRLEFFIRTEYHEILKETLEHYGYEVECYDYCRESNAHIIIKFERD
jgi:hypothetical protein